MVFPRSGNHSTVLNRLESNRPGNPSEADIVPDLPPSPRIPASPPLAKPNRGKLSVFEKELMDAWAEM